MDCSVAVVEGAPGAGPGRSVMLVSRGEGDVQLVAAKRPGGACASGVGGAAGAGSAAPPPPASNTLYPLRPPLPLVGVRPLMLEAAYMAQSGGGGGLVSEATGTASHVFITGKGSGWGEESLEGPGGGGGGW